MHFVVAAAVASVASSAEVAVAVVTRTTTTTMVGFDGSGPRIHDSFNKHKDAQTLDVKSDLDCFKKSFEGKGTNMNGR